MVVDVVVVFVSYVEMIILCVSSGVVRLLGARLVAVLVVLVWRE